VWERVPEAVRAVLDALAAAGAEAVLVGGCVRDLARGLAVRDWDVATSARPEAVLARFPRAVPVGLRFGTVMVPTPAGPVDVTSYRGPDLAADLAHRDFTWNALALRPGAEAPLDPFGGLVDLAAGRLRAPGDPRERLAEDPLRAVRAARFAAELGVAPDAALVAAMAEVAPRLEGVAAERKRAELERLLAAPRAGRGIALLRSTGLEARLVPGARADAAAVVDALPADLALRWAAWLRGAAAAPVLARLRVPRARAREVEALLQLHPVEEKVAARDAAVRRWLHRAGEAGAERLLRLREAECAAGSASEGTAARLAALRGALARVRRAEHLVLARSDLALDGRRVMELLGTGPGPEVGRALRHLTECVLDDPECNTRDALEARLLAWRGARRGERPAGGQESG
jgi:tRNA nucleotidyltransferase (CCA-adding enzyme)